MRRDLPSKFESQTISGSTTVTSHDMAIKGLFVADTAGIVITLPSPWQGIDGSECLVVNNSGGAITLSCADGFPNDADSLSLAAGASVLLYCARVGGSSYRWASVGATAS